VSTLTNGSDRSTRARKIVGSAAILGIAAAVAGLGTYSTFTDSTTPVSTGVTSGVLSISLMDGASVATAPFQGGTFMAGDSVSKALDLVNDGATGLASVTMRSWATESSVLDTDEVHGLQLLVRDCPVPWTGSGAAATCAGTATTLYSGPVVTTSELANPGSLAAGGVDHLMLTATLPATASGAAFQAASSSLGFAFDAVQRAGADR
jgi:hypothetical protein